mgnify:CR=1 FL=1
MIRQIAEQCGDPNLPQEIYEGGMAVTRLSRRCCLQPRQGVFTD